MIHEWSDNADLEESVYTEVLARFQASPEDIVEDNPQQFDAIYFQQIYAHWPEITQRNRFVCRGDITQAHYNRYKEMMRRNGNHVASIRERYLENPFDEPAPDVWAVYGTPERRVVFAEDLFPDKLEDAVHINGWFSSEDMSKEEQARATTKFLISLGLTAKDAVFYMKPPGRVYERRGRDRSIPEIGHFHMIIRKTPAVEKRQSIIAHDKDYDKSIYSEEMSEYKV